MNTLYSEWMKFNAQMAQKAIQENDGAKMDDVLDGIMTCIDGAASLGHTSIMLESENISNDIIERMRDEGFFVSHEGLYVFIGWY